MEQYTSFKSVLNFL